MGLRLGTKVSNESLISHLCRSLVRHFGLRPRMSVFRWVSDQQFGLRWVSQYIGLWWVCDQAWSHMCLWSVFNNNNNIFMKSRMRCFSDWFFFLKCDYFLFLNKYHVYTYKEIILSWYLYKGDENQDGFFFFFFKIYTV